MTSSGHELSDDALSRALHSAVDAVQPAADGLERIRARLGTPRPLPVAWATHAPRAAARLAAGRLDWLLEAIRPVLGPLLPVLARLRPAQPDLGRVQRRYGWLRPAAAMATIVAVVAMGALALKELPQAISPNSYTHTLGPGHHGGHPGGPAVTGSGSQLSPGATSSGSASGRSHGTASPSCPPSASAPASPTPSPSTSVSPSPTTSPTVSPTPTPSSSVSPSPTPTPTPSDATSPAPSSDSAPATSPAAAEDAAAAAPAGQAGPAPAMPGSSGKVPSVTALSASSCPSPADPPVPPPHVHGHFQSLLGRYHDGLKKHGRASTVR